MSKFTYLAARFIVAGGQKHAGFRLAFDIESNGLLDAATAAHCIVIADLDSDRIDEYGPDQIPAALEHLARADYLAGHNTLTFDLPFLRRLYGWAPRQDCTVIDTLIVSRLILPNLSDLDDQAAAMGDKALGKLRGRYSIEAWGARLGVPKTGTDIEDWSHWTPEMQARCVGDVAICKTLWHFLKPDGYSQQAIELEHRAAAICDEITAAGAPFDAAAAAELHQQWTERRSALAAQLQQQFPGTKLSSRKQIGALLEARGWVPEQRTEKTKQPKISAELLETIPEIYPEFAGLAEYMVLSARLASLATGKKAWSTHIGADGRIHGGIIHIGTPHSRAKHLEPNLAQVPNPKKGSPFGAECRALFHSSNGFVCVTADQGGLQDRGFAHYLSDFDAGAYAKTFANGASGDTHWQSATVLGLVPANTVRDKENKVHTMIREGSKRFRYAFLYGAGAARAGHIIYDTARAAGDGLLQQFFGDSPRPKEAALKRIGGSARKKFIAATPGLGRLLARLNTDAKKHEWLPGLDGRRVPVRALYTALNYIVCSSEAIICKRWLVRVYDELCARFRYGWDGDAVIALWVHDELVVYCRPEIADQVGEILVRNAKEPAEFYGFKVPLDADYKIGRSWAGEPLNGDANHMESKPRPVTQEDLDTINAGLEREGIKPGKCRVEPPPAPESESKPEPKPESKPADDGYTYGVQPHGPTTDGYVYKDAQGLPYMRVTRTSSHTFPTAHWQGGRWVQGWPPTVIPYRLPELLAAPAIEPVWIPEGEKDVNNVAALGLIATTNPGGAKVWQPELAQWFKDKQLVYILEDNDESGRDHTRKILAALTGMVPNIATISFPELPEKGDVSDWLAIGGNKQLLLARAEQALKQSKGLHAYIVTDLNTVQARAVRWLWHKHLARGALELLAGMPTVGKSQIQCQYVACVTTGRVWPNGAPGIIPCRAIMLTAEDNTDDTLVPRLIAAGADLTRVKELKAIRRNGKEELFLLGEDLAVLEQLIYDWGEVGLVTIDPITAYMGHAKHFDSHRATDVRSQLSPLKTLAERTGVAISAVTHPPKNVGQRALDHFIGSQAFIAAARLGHLCIEEMTEDTEGGIKLPSGRYLFTDAKPSIKARQPTLTYRIGVVETSQVDPDSGEPIEAPVIRWEGESELSADEAIAASRPGKNRGPNAQDFLQDVLAGGKVLAKTVIERGAAKGFSYKQLWRAKDAIGVIDFREKGVKAGPSYWALPQHAPDETEEGE